MCNLTIPTIIMCLVAIGSANLLEDKSGVSLQAGAHVGQIGIEADTKEGISGAVHVGAGIVGATVTEHDGKLSGGVTVGEGLQLGVHVSEGGAITGSIGIGVDSAVAGAHAGIAYTIDHPVEKAKEAINQAAEAAAHPFDEEARARAERQRHTEELVSELARRKAEIENVGNRVRAEYAAIQAKLTGQNADFGNRKNSLTSDLDQFKSRAEIFNLRARRGTPSQFCRSHRHIRRGVGFPAGPSCCFTGYDNCMCICEDNDMVGAQQLLVDEQNSLRQRGEGLNNDISNFHNSMTSEINAWNVKKIEYEHMVEAYNSYVEQIKSQLSSST